MSITEELVNALNYLSCGIKEHWSEHESEFWGRSTHSEGVQGAVSYDVVGILPGAS
jgi:hypothetical protein